MTRVGDRQHVVEEVRDEDDAAAARRAAGAARANRRSTSGGDSAEVGSSRMMMRAPENSTRASSISCCRPIGSAPMRRARIDVDAEARRGARARLARHARASRRCRAALTGCLPRIDVLGDRQVGHDRSAPDAPCRCRRPARRAAERKCTGRPSSAHLALVIGVHAGDDLHQRRLAGAVLADQTMDLAGAQREVDVAQRRRRRRTTSRCRSSAQPVAADGDPDAGSFDGLARHARLRSGSDPPSTACRRRSPW